MSQAWKGTYVGRKTKIDNNAIWQQLTNAFDNYAKRSFIQLIFEQNLPSVEDLIHLVESKAAQINLQGRDSLSLELILRSLFEFSIEYYGSRHNQKLVCFFGTTFDILSKLNKV